MYMKTTRILIPILAMLFISASVDANARKIPRKKIYDEIYSTTGMIDGVYIPENVKDAMKELDRMVSDEDKELLRTKADGLDLHFGFGMWLRNDWGLWGNSRIYTYLINKGCCYHPDDASSYLIYRYLDYLHGKKVTEPEKKKMSKESRDRIKELRKSTGKGNPDFWKYNYGSTDYKKSMVGKGLKKGAALKFKYPFGFTTPEEESKYKSQGGGTAVCEGVITDVNYEWGYIKVRLTKTVSPYGIIVFDGTQKPVGQKYIEADYKRLSRKGENRYFMKEGEEMWFFFRDSYALWEVCGEAL